MTPEEQAARETWRGVMEIHYRHQRSEEKSNTAKWNLSAGEGWQIIAAAIEQARREEREACAKIAETEFSGNGTHLTWREIAAAIRARAEESEG